MIFKFKGNTYSIITAIVLSWILLCLLGVGICNSLTEESFLNSQSSKGQNEAETYHELQSESLKQQEILESESESKSNSECKDDYPSYYCTQVVEGGECNLDAKALLCRQSCHLCTKSMSMNERSDKCKNMLPQCEAAANPVFCCGLKPMTNVTCAEACKFCHNIIVPTLPTPNFVPGMNPPTPEAPVVYSDPCDPSKPPSASGGGVPGVPSQGGGSSGNPGFSPPNFGG